MRNKLSRVLAMILAATMTVNTLPMSVFATAPESPSQNPPVEDEFNEQEDDELDDDEVVHPEGTIENEDGTFTYPDGTIHDAEGNLIEEEEKIESSPEPTVSEVIEVSDITLDETVLEVGVGELPMILTATVWPEDATDKTITWRSSDPGVVSVDENGELTFGYMGEAVITATAGEFSAECVVTVGEGDAAAYDVPEDFVDAAIMFSDLHSMYSGTNDEGSKGYKKDVVTNMMNVFKDTGLPFSSVISCGDVFSSNESQYIGYTDTITGYIQNVLGDIPVKYVWSDHDRGAQNNATAKTPLDKTSYVAYGAGEDGVVGTSDDGEYYVYSLSMADICSYDRYEAGFNYTEFNNQRASKGFTATVPEAIADFEAEAAKMHKDRPLLIASHMPLFDDRNDNAWAEDWYNAISKVANGMDVVFFYGHNHNHHDTSSDYYYEKGSKMKVATRTHQDGTAWNYDYQTGVSWQYEKNLKSVEKTLNFTHVCAGYLNPGTTGSQNSLTRQNAALAVAIYDNRIELDTYYNTNTNATEQKYPLDVTIERVHAVAEEPTPEETVIPEGYALARIEVVNQGNTKYFLNDTLDTENLSVEAVYTKENATDIRKPLTLQTEENADGYTISVDMSKAGKQYVTVTYGECVGSYAIEVYKTRFENATGTVAVDFTNYGITSVTITEAAKEVEGYSAYVTYDITPVGYTQGDVATVSITLDTEKFDVTRPVKVLDKGNVIAVPEIVEGKITFTTNHFSEYDVAQVDADITDVDVTKWKEVSAAVGGTTTYTYTLADTITAGQKYVIVANGDYDVALMDNDGTMGSAKVTITDTTMTSTNTALTEWTFSGSSKGTVQSDKNRFIRYGSSQFSLNSNESTELTFTKKDSAFKIWYDRNYQTDYSFYYNGSTWTRDRGDKYVRLYQLTKTENVGGTPATYAQIVGNNSYQVAAGGTADDTAAAALAAVKTGITVYKTNNNTSAAGTFVDDNDTNVTWTLAANDNGTYTVTIKYNGVELGTATVEVVERNAKSVTLDKNEGTVERGSGADVATGATLTVTWEDDRITYVPVTVGMLSGNSNLNVNKNGTYSGLSFSYEGYNFYDFTLKVVNKKTNESGEAVDDFPTYPNPGSVDVKKSATGVDFQNTGLARVELSTSGLPYSKGIDVIVMLDLSSSMVRCIDHDTKNHNCTSGSRLNALKTALTTLETELKKSPNKENIKVAIADFNGFYTGSSPVAYDNNDTIEGSLSNAGSNQVFTGTKTFDAGAFESASTLNISGTNGINSKLSSAQGTNYDYAFDTIYQLGTAIRKQNEANGQGDRQLIVMFMSDGASNQFNFYRSIGGDSNTAEDPEYGWNYWLTGTMTDAQLKAANQGGLLGNANHAYYYDKNDHDGDGVLNEHRMANAIKGDPDKTYEVIRKSASVAGGVTLADGSKDNLYLAPGLGATMYSVAFDIAHDGPITDEAIFHSLEQIATSDDYYINAANEGDLKDAFHKFAVAIVNAATNARYVDQMGDSFNLQLNPYIHTNNPNTPSNDDKYAEADTSIVITTRPVYTKEQVGTTVNNHAVTADDVGKPYGNGTPVETVSFVANKKTHALTKVVTNAGGYTLPNGTTVEAGTTDIMLKGVIYGKNFFYNNNNYAVDVTLADGTTYSLPGETFYWNIGTISEVQYTMSYTVYLEGAMEGTPPADSYQTNNFAILYYTNHVGNEVSKSVPSPTMAWKGATVSYAFYLVNKQGQPVHADGTEAQNFLQAHKITQPVVYQSIKLNSDGVTVAALNAIANDVLPEGYYLYAPDASYHIEVGSGNQQNANPSYWQIQKDPDQTTYVMGFGDANDYSKVQLVKADSKANPEYASYDYTHTIVYFAVTWTLGAVQDTVVIDYGLPVDINVMANDMFGTAGTLHAVGTRGAKPDESYGSTLAAGFSTTEPIAGKLNPFEGTFGTAEIKNGKIRYTLKEKNMVMNHAETLAYAVDYEDPNKTDKLDRSGFYYGDLTIIPATTIYFEDEYVDLKTFTRPDTTTKTYTEAEGWPTNSKNASGVQAEDRPGSFNLSVIDANNIYGYDQAYDQMSTYSMGNSAMIHVDATQYGTAEFSFYGTGFDVISATSNKTGTLVVQVYDANNNLVELNGKKLSNAVDTYYGYTYGLYHVIYEKNEKGQWTLVSIGDPVTNTTEGQTKEDILSSKPNEDGTVTGRQYVWKPVNNNPNALYQVPVIKYSGLPYAQYKVKITATYYSAFDSTAEAGYDLYLDAIRIYDPAGTTYGEDNDTDTDNDTIIDSVIQDAYIADGEAWPSYRELRDMIISVDDFNCLPENSTESVSGIVFIDGATSTGAGNLTGDVGPAGDQITGKTPQISDYFNYGPNNELYLASGQAVAFTMNLGSANDHTGYVPVVHIGMKTVGSKKAVAELWSVNANTGTRYNEISDTLLTATDMYYDITVLNGGIVVIKNSGAEGSILSITNIKLAYKATTMVTTPPASGGSEQQTLMFSISRSAANAALLSLQTTEETIPEDTEPETPPTEPETDSETKPTEPESKPEVKPEKPAKADNSELKSTVDAVKKLKEKDYTKESYEEFKAALKEAEKVLKDKKATQKQIDEVLVKLNDAVEALEVKAPATKPAKPAESAKPETTDNSELKSVVEAAKKLKEKDFTKESYGEFKATLKNVEKVLNDKNATPTQIYEALVELNDAVEALETKPTASEESKPKQEKENADKPVEDENSEQFERPAASTVDELLAKLKNAIEWLLELLFGWLN